MKKLLLLTLSVLTLGFASQAQVQKMLDREVTAFKEPYARISIPTGILADTIGWDDPENAIFTMPFTTEFLGKTISTLEVSAANQMMANTDILNSASNVVIGMAHDIENRNSTSTPNPLNNSSISYTITGVAPQRIVKVQYDNVGFYDDLSHNRFANYQIWFYEKDSAVEFRFGPHNLDADFVTDTLYEGHAMVSAFYDIDINATPIPSLGGFYVLTGNGLSTPTVDSLTIFDLATENYKGFSDWPADSTVYRFARAKAVDTIPASINQPLTTSVATVASTISNGTLSVDFKAAPQGLINLYTTNGQLIKSFTCLNGQNTYNVTDLSSGTYIVTILNDGMLYRYRVVK